MLDYDALVVALGGVPEATLPGALTFGGEQDAEKIQALLGEIAAGGVHDLVFVVPGGIAWPFALYELALLTAKEVEHTEVRLSLVSAEPAPLAHFGDDASAAVSELLAERGIQFVAASYPVRIDGSSVVLAPHGRIPADRVVALARVRPPVVPGLPVDRDGFVPADPHGCVLGAEDVYAAGDVTSFPLKQGGIAVQQAQAVAEAVAASFGAVASPRPFRPVLRGRLLTGNGPQYLQRVAAGGAGETSTATAEPLWWPPSKIAGGRLAAYLTEHGLPVTPVSSVSLPASAS
jgi:sulfide:quinone oxidoreductase